jgi:glycosyltransferase involved in cell wall biosynthesis
MAPVKAVWASDVVRDIQETIDSFEPDVLHVHNTWLRLSPAIYWAANRKGVPVVQTLHNYRLMCPMGLFLRDGEPCEECLGKTFAYPGVAYECYHDSWLKSALSAGVPAIHRAMGTWNSKVDRYIALTDFAQEKFIEGGLPEDRVVVKPNHVSDPGIHSDPPEAFAIFVGRLSEEKAPDVLLEAWDLMEDPPVLKIVGEGPMESELRDKAHRMNNVDLMGRIPRADVIALMKNAMMLVFPSIWYEGMPMTILEAYSVGLPVVASDIGAMSSLVRNDETGLKFESGQARELAEKVKVLQADPDKRMRLRSGARSEYEERFAPETNYRALHQVYVEAQENKE